LTATSAAKAGFESVALIAAVKPLRQPKSSCASQNQAAPPKIKLRHPKSSCATQNQAAPPKIQAAPPKIKLCHPKSSCATQNQAAPPKIKLCHPKSNCATQKQLRHPKTTAPPKIRPANSWRRILLGLGWWLRVWDASTAWDRLLDNPASLCMTGRVLRGCGRSSVLRVRLPGGFDGLVKSSFFADKKRASGAEARVVYLVLAARLNVVPFPIGVRT